MQIDDCICYFNCTSHGSGIAIAVVGEGRLTPVHRTLVSGLLC